MAGWDVFVPAGHIQGWKPNQHRGKGKAHHYGLGKRGDRKSPRKPKCQPDSARQGLRKPASRPLTAVGSA